MTDGSESLDEIWVDVFDFPGYALSNWGRVLNKNTGCQVKPHYNTRGIVMVGLMKNGIQAKRSLSVLVATAFVSRPRNPSFDTPIHLDGDRDNNYASNLMWRPLWFARKYSQQFSDDHPTCLEVIEDVETGEVYQSSLHASMVNGVLDFDIYMSMLNNTYVFPTGQIFRQVLH